MSGNWKKNDNYSIQHRNGNRVNKVGNRYEVWYLVNRQYRHGGMHDDPEVAKQAAAKGIQPDESQ